MTKYCRYCGAENNDDAKVCVQCGRSLEKKVKSEHERRKGIGNILKEAFSIIKENPMIVVPYVGLFILSVVISIAIPSPETSRESIWNIYLSKTGGAGILLDFIGVFTGAIAIVMTYTYKTENVKMPLGDALRKTMSKTVTLIGTWILFFVILLIIVFVAYSSMNVGLLATIVIPLIGLFIFLVFGILVSVFFALIYQGVMIDNLGIIDTFKKSYEIAKRNFWDIFSIMLIIGILVGIPIVCIMFIGNILNSNFNWTIFARSLMLFANCYIAVALTLLYLNRK